MVFSFVLHYFFKLVINFQLITNGLNLKTDGEQQRSTRKLFTVVEADAKYLRHILPEYRSAGNSSLSTRLFLFVWN